MSDEKQNEKMLDSDVGKLRAIVLKWIERGDNKSKPRKARKMFFQKPKTASVKIKNAEPLKIPTRAIKPSRKKLQLKYFNLKAYLVGLKIILISLLISIIVLLVLGAGVYFTGSNNQTIRGVASIIPFPIAFVNFKPLFYSDWLDKVLALRNFYQRIQLDDPAAIVPTLKETEKHILERMIERELLNQLAKKYSIEITSSDIIFQTKQIADELGSQQLLENQLLNLYRWSIKDFQTEIIEPLLLKGKLNKLIAVDESINKNQMLDAEELFQRIKDSSAGFDQAISELNGDEVVFENLGYLVLGQMPPQFDDMVFTLEAGEISPIIRTEAGFHIVQVTEKIGSGPTARINARQFLIKSVQINDYLAELRNKASIWVLINS